MENQRRSTLLNTQILLINKQENNNILLSFPSLPFPFLLVVYAEVYTSLPSRMTRRDDLKKKILDHLLLFINYYYDIKTARETIILNYRLL